MDFNMLLRFAVDNDASDVHIQAGLPPCLRIGGILRSTSEAPLTDGGHEADGARAGGGPQGAAELRGGAAASHAGAGGLSGAAAKKAFKTRTL